MKPKPAFMSQELGNASKCHTNHRKDFFSTIHVAINKQNKYKYIQRTKIIWDVDCHVIPNYRQKAGGGGAVRVDNI